MKLFLPHPKMVDMVTAQCITVRSGLGICLAIGERKAVLSECFLKPIEIDIIAKVGFRRNPGLRHRARDPAFGSLPS
jgi:hypothetical protein